MPVLRLAADGCLNGAVVRALILGDRAVEVNNGHAAIVASGSHGGKVQGDSRAQRGAGIAGPKAPKRGLR